MSAHLPQFSPAEAIGAFKRLGFSVVPNRGKGHTIMARAGHHAILSIPNHRELRRGLLRSLLRDAGVSVEDFVQLVREPKH